MVTELEQLTGQFKLRSNPQSQLAENRPFVSMSKTRSMARQMSLNLKLMNLDCSDSFIDGAKLIEQTFLHLRRSSVAYAIFRNPSLMALWRSDRILSLLGTTN